MRTLLASAAIAGLVLPQAALGDIWQVDPSHTEVLVTWNHAGFSMQSLKFHAVEGQLDFTPGDPESATAEFSILVESVDTGVEMLDTELVGEAFFNAAEFPRATFVARQVTQTGDMTVAATGDLTIRDVTAPVTFEITVHALGEHPLGQFFDVYKGDWLGMTATATVSRSAFGLGALPFAASDEVEIEINTELKAGGFPG